jgi:acetyl esterase/lipase
MTTLKAVQNLVDLHAHMHIKSYQVASVTDNFVICAFFRYRLMPEHRFPVQFEDCVKATEYFFQNAKSYQVDPLRIGIAGNSYMCNK